MMRSALEQFADYAKHNKKLPEDIEEDLAAIDEAGRLADTIAGALQAKVATKQAILSEPLPLKRLELVFSVMEGELSVLQVERKIRGRVKRQMEKTQREYYLNEQLKAIQSELGGGEGEEVDESPNSRPRSTCSRCRRRPRPRPTRNSRSSRPCSR